MKRIVIFTIGLVVESPDDNAGVCAPLPHNPLDELVARLRREACYGRDCADPGRTPPDMTVWLAAAFQECHG